MNKQIVLTNWLMVAFCEFAKEKHETEVEPKYQYGDDSDAVNYENYF